MTASLPRRDAKVEASCTLQRVKGLIGKVEAKQAALDAALAGAKAILLNARQRLDQALGQYVSHLSVSPE